MPDTMAIFAGSITMSAIAGRPGSTLTGFASKTLRALGWKVVRCPYAEGRPGRGNPTM